MKALLNASLFVSHKVQRQSIQLFVSFHHQTSVHTCPRTTILVKQGQYLGVSVNLMLFRYAPSYITLESDWVKILTFFIENTKSTVSETKDN